MKRRFIILIIVLLQSVRIFSQDIDSISIICQHEIVAGKNFPIALLFYHDGIINNHITGDYLIESGNFTISDSIVKVKKGVGTLTTNITTSGTFELKIHATTLGKFINVSNESQIINIGGELSDNIVLSENTTYRVTNDLTIPEDATLTIPKGITILLDHEVNIFIHGEINIIGELNNPVVFGSYYPDQPWGGMILLNIPDTSLIRYSFFIS